AADRFASDQEDTSGISLARNLEEAKKRRREFDDTAAANISLAARYAALQDDPRSRRHDRIEVLEKRREALFFLLEHGPVDRGGAWQQDLREVQISLLQEQADQAEQQLEAAGDLDERERLCRRMLELLGRAGSAPGLSTSIGRVQRLLERWYQHHEHVRAQ